MHNAYRQQRTVVSLAKTWRDAKTPSAEQAALLGIKQALQTLEFEEDALKHGNQTETVRMAVLYLPAFGMWCVAGMGAVGKPVSDKKLDTFMSQIYDKTLSPLHVDNADEQPRIVGYISADFPLPVKPVRVHARDLDVRSLAEATSTQFPISVEDGPTKPAGFDDLGAFDESTCVEIKASHQSPTTENKIGQGQQEGPQQGPVSSVQERAAAGAQQVAQTSAPSSPPSE